LVIIASSIGVGSLVAYLLPLMAMVMAIVLSCVVGSTIAYLGAFGSSWLGWAFILVSMALAITTLVLASCLVSIAFDSKVAFFVTLVSITGVLCSRNFHPILGT